MNTHLVSIQESRLIRNFTLEAMATLMHASIDAQDLAKRSHNSGSCIRRLVPTSCQPSILARYSVVHLLENLIGSFLEVVDKHHFAAIFRLLYS